MENEEHPSTARSRQALERSMAKPGDVVIQTAKPDPEELARMEDALRRLPRMQRAIFLAIRIDDLSYTEIAKRTCLTERQVERYFRNALINFFRNCRDPKRHWWRRWL